MYISYRKLLGSGQKRPNFEKIEQLCANTGHFIKINSANITFHTKKDGKSVQKLIYITFRTKDGVTSPLTHFQYLYSLITEIQVHSIS